MNNNELILNFFNNDEINTEQICTYIIKNTGSRAIKITTFDGRIFSFGDFKNQNFSKTITQGEFFESGTILHQEGPRLSS